jgi:hypothetical protein
MPLRRAPSKGSQNFRGRAVGGRSGSGGAAQGESKAGSTYHSLTIGGYRAKDRSIEYTAGIQHLDKISGGAIQRPMAVSKAVAEQAEAYAVKHTEQANNAKDFYTKAKKVSGEQADIVGYWAEYVETNMDNGLRQYESNTGIAQKQLETQAKQAGVDWKLAEATEAQQAVKQEFQLNPRMKAYA